MNKMKKQYKIESGRPSWHQSKVGHIFSGTLIVSLTLEELERWRNKLEKKGEPFRITTVK
tara:strand:- start:2074 stop:2253 length:180 start_codon:yes stop_codon:yes gene_type:complete